MLPGLECNGYSQARSYALQPQASGLKRFPKLSLLSSWNYNCAPPHLGYSIIFLFLFKKNFF